MFESWVSTTMGGQCRDTSHTMTNTFARSSDSSKVMPNHGPLILVHGCLAPETGDLWTVAHSLSFIRECTAHKWSTATLSSEVTPALTHTRPDQDDSHTPRDEL